MISVVQKILNIKLFRNNNSVSINFIENIKLTKNLKIYFEKAKICLFFTSCHQVKKKAAF